MRGWVACGVATILLAQSIPGRAQTTPRDAIDAGTPATTQVEADAGASPAELAGDVGPSTAPAATDAGSTAAQVATDTGPSARDARWAAGDARARTSAEEEAAEQRARDGTFVWGLIALELFTAAAIIMRVGIDPDSEILPEALVLSLPLPLAAPVAVFAYLGRWDVRIPYAVHGGAWTGALMGLFGALLDGARLDRGTTAETDALFFVLGAAGAFVGAAFGATQIDDSTESVVWVATPAITLGVELAVAIVWAIVTFGGGSATEGEQFLGWSTVVTGAIGLGIAHAFVL